MVSNSLDTIPLAKMEVFVVLPAHCPPMICVGFCVSSLQREADGVRPYTWFVIAVHYAKGCYTAPAVALKYIE